MATEKKHYSYNDLYDRLLADTTPKKAVELKNIIKDILNYRAMVGALYLIMGVVVMCLLLSGLVYIGELVNPPDKPADWPTMGIAFLFLGCGALIGYISATSDHLDRIKRRVIEIIDKAIEGDKD